MTTQSGADKSSRLTAIELVTVLSCDQRVRESGGPSDRQSRGGSSSSGKMAPRTWSRTTERSSHVVSARLSTSSRSLPEKTRLLVARLEGERYPMICGAMSESTWEVIGPEDWDKWKREMLEKAFGPDWTAYDTVEVLITIPSSQLNEMFDAREVQPHAVEMVPDA